MAGPVTFTLAAQAFRVGSTMLLTVLVSRFLGAEALGLLTLGLTLATIATVVASLGVDQGVIRFVARAQPGVASAPAAVRTALIIAATGGVAAGSLAWLIAPMVANVLFGAPALRIMLLIFALTIPPTAILAAALGAMQGSFLVVQRSVIEWIAFPLLTLALAAGVLLSGRGVNGVAVSYLIAWLVVAVVGVSIALRIPGDAGPLIFRPMLALSLPLMLSLLTGYLLFHVDVLMLGGLAGIRDVGLYSVATRLALPLFLVLDSVARAFAPMVAHLYPQQQIERLGSVYAAATEWILAINVAAGVLIAMNAESILRLFGDEFVAAAMPLRVLCLGIVAATSCGAAASMLTMTRWQRLEMIDNLLLLLINVALNALLIPRFGALGAAFATATSATSVYALKVLQVRWLLSLQPFRPRQAASALLALVAAATSWLATQPLDVHEHLELAVRVVVFAATYGMLWWRWGCSATSREVLQSIMQRQAPEAAKLG